jgi:hypothetical protein
MRHNDRPAVFEFDLVDVPSSAGHSTAQGIDGQLKLVAGFQNLARPAVAREAAWSAPFEIPKLGAAAGILDLENDEGVGTLV